MSSKDGTSSVFTDDSGSRLRAVTLAIRGSVIVLGLGAASIAISVLGHVTLPGLDAPLHLPGSNRATPANNDTDAVRERSKDAIVPTVAATIEPTSSKSSDGKTATSVKATESPTSPASPAAPTASTKAKKAKHATGKPTARPTPPHEPGVPPTEPPGQSKKHTTGQ